MVLSVAKPIRKSLGVIAVALVGVLRLGPIAAGSDASILRHNSAPHLPGMTASQPDRLADMFISRPDRPSHIVHHNIYASGLVQRLLREKQECQFLVVSTRRASQCPI